MGQTLGFQAEVRFIAEASEGAGIPSTGTLSLLSDSTVLVTPRVSRTQDPLPDIGSPKAAVSFAAGIKEFGLTLEWNWQDSAGVLTLITDFITRLANGDLKTYAFELATNVDSSAKAYYSLATCKCDELELIEDENKVLKWRATLMPLDVTTATAAPVLPGTTTRQTAAIGSSYFHFIGAKVESPSGTAIAFSTRSAGFRVKHNLEGIPNAGSGTMKTYSPKKTEVTFRGNISVDDGGKALWDAVAAGTTADVVIYSSATAGKPKFTIQGTPLPEIEFSADVENSTVRSDIERPGTGIVIGTV